MQPNYQSITGHTRRLAAFSAALTYDDIPPDVIVMVKRLLLDTLGCTLAATTLGAGCRETARAMVELGGRPESTILGSASKVAAPNAALANGALAHALNYDALGPETGHIGVVCLTAPLAMTEALGDVTGREFLAAAVVASEVTARVTAAQSRTGKPSSEKFMAGQLFGYFGAAAAAGNLLGFTADQMRSAFGIALMQTSGTMQVVLGGDPPAKAIYGAFPNHGGILAALLSKAGLDGQCDAIEGSAGIYEMFYRGEYQEDALTTALGADFLLMRTQFKPWPISSVAHPFIEAAGEIAKKIKPSSVKAVEIIGDRHIRPWCEPAEERQAPQNPASAANSVPFGVAKALANGDLMLKDFTVEGLKDGTATAIAKRTSYKLEGNLQGGTVKVTTNDGQTHCVHIATPLGHSSKPMPYERLVKKFTECCSYAANKLSAEHIRQLIDMIENLENVDPRRLAAIAGGTP